MPIAGPNWGKWADGAGFLGNISKQEGGGALPTYQAALVKMSGHRRQRAGPKAPRRIKSPNLAGATGPRYRHQSKYRAPPNGGNSSQKRILRIAKMRTEVDVLVAAYGSRAALPPDPTGWRAGMALRRHRSRDAKQCDGGLFRIARRAYRGAELGGWPGGAGYLGNISKPEGGGARPTQKAALVKMRGPWRQRVCPKAPRRITSQNLAGTTSPRYRHQSQ